MYLFTYISIYFYYCKIQLHTLLADFFFQVHQFDSYTHLDANTHTEKDTHTYTGTIASCILTSILQCHLTFVTATGTKRCRLQCSAVRVMASGKRNAGGEIEGSRKSGRRKRGWAGAGRGRRRGEDQCSRSNGVIFIGLLLFRFTDKLLMSRHAHTHTH